MCPHFGYPVVADVPRRSLVPLRVRAYGVHLSASIVVSALLRGCPAEVAGADVCGLARSLTFRSRRMVDNSAIS